MMYIIKNLQNRLKETSYGRIAFVVSIATILVIAGLATAVSQPKAASADKLKVEEFSGIRGRVSTTTFVDETISNCGDADATTNVVIRTSTGAVTYTGFMEGTGEVWSKSIRDTCTGVLHTIFRTLDTFESLTVAGKTGGAVVEAVGTLETVASGKTIFTTPLRILCGTGELKNIHGEGIGIGSTIPGSASGTSYFSVHFGHNHDVGYDFLCEDLN